MLTLNLINREKSDIPFSISRFPDGEVQVTLGEFKRKESILVLCRITNAEELFIISQVINILDRHGVVYDINIYYLMGMRMDRVMDFNRPFTLEIVIDILSNSKAENIRVLEPHSTRFESLGGERFSNLEDPFLIGLKKGLFITHQIVLPDAGAKARYQTDSATVLCSKIREEATGKLLKFQVDNPSSIHGNSLLIMDDLCDGGGTFCGIAEELKKYVPEAEIDIFVTHMVNPRGIDTLSLNFKRVYFTNSYRTWRNLPDNVTQLEIV